MNTEIVMTKTEYRLWNHVNQARRLSGQNALTKKEFLALSSKERENIEGASVAERGDAGSTF